MTPTPEDDLLEECMRWFGPGDPVPLNYIRHAGATAVFTSLHQIPYGEVWPREAIRERKQLLAAAGLGWAAVESVPVHEDIKTGSGTLACYLNNYARTLQNLAAEGVHTVIYNFMPVLDWVRTDMRHVLPDGTECLLFDPVKLCAFELHALRRPGAEADFTPEQIEAAGRWWAGLADDARAAFVQTILDVFPGVKWGLTLDDIRARLAAYARIGRVELSANLGRFLSHVVPVAAEFGLRLAIHPDDPPFPVLGLPRIVSTAGDVEAIFALVEHEANGLCFCSGSFGARPDNDLVAMARRFAPRIHAVHLRATKRLPSGVFFEADHLDGDVDMPAVLRALLDEQDRRMAEGRTDWRLPLRPDHGHVMMHDLDHHVPLTPGYSPIGRMRGLAELRGVMHGLRSTMHASAFPSSSADVIVVGAGVGGVAAAIAAARAGASVLLLEAAPEIGGTGVHSPVGLICTFADRAGRIINDGLHREFFPQIAEGPSAGFKAYDERELARLYRAALAAEPALRVRTSARAEAVVVEGACVRALRLADGSTVSGRVWVDATADGNLAVLAGAQAMVGRDEDGASQPATLTFVVEGIEWEKFAAPLPPGGPDDWASLGRARRELDPLYQALKARGATSNPREDVLFFPLPGRPGAALFNQTRIVGVVPWDAASVAAGLREGRKQIDEFWTAIREHPAFARARIASISEKLGVREGRRILGDHVLTGEECLAEARFDDMVAACGYALDIHNPAGSGTVMKSIPGSGYYHIPYRSLRAAGLHNLLLGSRCISGTHEAHSSYRVMSSVCSIGQAAGVAAALTARRDGQPDVRAIEASAIRAELRRQGQFTEEPAAVAARAVSVEQAST